MTRSVVPPSRIRSLAFNSTGNEDRLLAEADEVRLTAVLNAKAALLTS